GGVGGEHDAVGAAAANDVPQATEEHPELMRRSGRCALVDVIATRGAALGVGGAGQAAQAGIRGGAAVHQPGAGDIADPAALGDVTPLPILLVAADAD